MAYPVAQDIYDELVNFKVTDAIMSASKVDSYILESVWIIEDMIGRKLDEESTITEYCSGDNTNTLLLNHKNINEIISIQYTTRPEIYYTGTISYILENEGVVVLPERSFFRKGDDNIKVVYKIGGSITEREKKAIVLIASELVLNELSQITGGGSIAVQGWSKNYGDRGMFSTYKQDLKRRVNALLSTEVTSVRGQ